MYLEVGGELEGNWVGKGLNSLEFGGDGESGVGVEIGRLGRGEGNILFTAIKNRLVGYIKKRKILSRMVLVSINSNSPISASIEGGYWGKWDD